MSNESYEVNRQQIEHRAEWLALIYDELKKSGADAEGILRRAVRRCGHNTGERIKKQCKQTGGALDFGDFKKNFLTPLAKETFSISGIQDTPSSLSIDFNYCALVESWKKLGFDAETIKVLCDIAMEGDRGMSEVLGLKFELGDVIAAGCKTCQLRFSV